MEDWTLVLKCFVTTKIALIAVLIAMHPSRLYWAHKFKRKRCLPCPRRSELDSAKEEEEVVSLTLHSSQHT